MEVTSEITISLGNIVGNQELREFDVLRNLLPLHCQSTTNGIGNVRYGNKDSKSDTPRQDFWRTKSKGRERTDSEVQHRVA